MRSRAKYPIERFESLAVGQEEVDQYRRDTMRPLSLLRGQAIQPLEAVSDPFNLKRPIARVCQCLLNAPGVYGIVLDQKYILRHNIPLPAKIRLVEQGTRATVCAAPHKEIPADLPKLLRRSW